eukprot:2398553-Rhodomonas_salina.2
MLWPHSRGHHDASAGGRIIIIIIMRQRVEPQRGVYKGAETRRGGLTRRWGRTGTRRGGVSPSLRLGQLW